MSEQLSHWLGVLEDVCTWQTGGILVLRPMKIEGTAGDGGKAINQ